MNRSRFIPEVWYLHETESPLKTVLQEAGVSTRCLNAPKKFQPRYLLKIAKELKHSGVDLLHIFLPTVGYYAVVSRFLFRSKIPAIYSCGGVQLLLPLQGFMMKYGLGRYCYPIVCNSRRVMDFWRDMKIDESRLKLIHNGHDISQFTATFDRNKYREKLGLGDTDFAIITVGRLIETKRHADLLNACAKLKASQLNFQILIAGDGPLQEALHQQATGLGLASRVHFLGTRDDVVALLRASDVFAFPSESEGLPNAVIEAALCKLPIVASDIKPVLEIVDSERSATIVPVRDVSALAAGIQFVSENPRLVEKMSAAAYQEAVAKFDLRQAINQLEHAYEDALRGFAPSSQHDETVF
ncbi:MAG: glycosyltransferase [Mariniblastus sp.]|nr:glycosyltransferase [Mariniblastus sp.]